MGMIVISSTLGVGQIAQTIGPDGSPAGDAGSVLERSFVRFADDLAWWTEAAKTQLAKRKPPY
jgi:hypothetical protein